MINIPKKTLTSLLLLVPSVLFADANLTLVTVKPFEKSIYQAAENQNINNGSPTDKQSFALESSGKAIGYFLAGQGFNQRDDSVCFVAWSTQSPHITTLIPTIGYGNWESEICNDTKAVGIISAPNNTALKLAVIYQVQSPNATATESVIFNVSNSALAVDENLTERIGAQGATTIKELKSLYNNQ
ncbi:hypothetical protein [Rouxiella sp. Mn2063]|uniref:hypothetical protein n=1 Tax=Rouxiella sp. Mn2063 TaxID=3395262 RepID=UPI003BE4B2C7